MSFDLSSLTFQVLLFLSPGLVSLQLSCALRGRSLSDTFEKLTQALIFALLNLVGYSLLAWIWNMAISKKLPYLSEIILFRQGEMIFDFSAFLSPITLFFLFAVACLVGLLHAIVLEQKPAIFWYLERINLTKKTGSEEVWVDSLRELEDSWVRVRLPDETIAQGYPAFYSEPGKKKELLLKRVTIFKEGKELESFDALYVSDKSSLEVIEFWNASCRKEKGELESGEENGFQ